MQRDELAVEIGEGDGVVVNERDGAHTRARQRLCRKASHAADAEDGDVTGGKNLHCLVSQQHPLPVKLRFCHSSSYHKGLPCGSPLFRSSFKAYLVTKRMPEATVS